MAISEATPGLAVATRLGPSRLLGDEQLARGAAGGDPRAFELIFARYHQELYRYCRAILGNADDAEDATQATMAAALRSLPGESREISLRSWLYRVAHNEAISIVRRRQPLAGSAEVPEVAVDGVEAQAESRRRLRELVADLRALPERQRSALVMRELSGLSYEEIGAALGGSEGAARQTVYEARVALGELEAGREMDCDDARRTISERDGRLLSGRRIRAHLRACEGCRDFREAIPRRRAELQALCPPLPALAAAGLLSSVLGGSGGGATTGAAAGATAAVGGGASGTATALGGAAASGAAAGPGVLAGAFGASAAVKAASVAAAVAIGAGTAGATGVVELPLLGGSGSAPSHSVPTSPSPAVAHHEPAGAAATPAERSQPGAPDGRGDSAHGRGHEGAGAGVGGQGRGRAVGRHRRDASAPTHGVPASPGAGRALGHSGTH